MNQESRIKEKKLSKSIESIRDSLFFIPDSTQKGFSIIETIVAIAILSFAMVGPLSLAQRSLNASMYAKDQVTAFFLAQEAIEYARYVRDTNNLLGRSGSNDWLRGLENCVADAGHANQLCGIDVTDATGPKVVDCTSDQTLCRLYFNTDSTIGTYGLQSGSGWKQTIFTRTVKIEPKDVSANPLGEADITATVTWKSGFISRNMSVKEHIFNWFPIAP